MKKLYAFILALLSIGFVNAQADVTFNVDMQFFTVSELGVHMAGNFNQGGLNPDLVDWTPGAIMLSDDDNDGIYSVTLSLQTGNYEYKFINGNDWGMDESVPVECAQNGNRFVDVADVAMDIDPVCYTACAACPSNVSVTFNVDMSNEAAISPAGVHLAHNLLGGSIVDPSTWVALTDNGDGTWSTTVDFDVAAAPDPIEYRFVNGDMIINPTENMTGSACGNDAGNRELESFTGISYATPFYCFNECVGCAQPQSITLSVDMSLQTVSANGVHVAGNFETAGTGSPVNPYPEWNPGGIALTDENSDMIYTVTLDLVPGTYQYKFINGDNWDGEGNDNESVPAECNEGGNRSLVVVEGEDQSIAYCYNQCSATCVSDPDAAEITFVVDMTLTPASADGVFLIGAFTDPQWQGGAIALTEGADNLWSATVLVDGPAEIQYKFVNGSVDDAANEEGAGIGEGDCSIDNGVGGFNRVHQRSGQPETLGDCYDLCGPCTVSVEEESGVAIKAYPNPATDFVSVEITSGFSGAIELIDATGRMVQQISPLKGQRIVQFSVEHLEAGIYFLSLNDGENNYSTRLIVE